MPRHAQYTSVILTCDNCGCRLSIQTGRRQRRNVCQLKEIMDCLKNFTPGTRFESKGKYYTITANYRLERIAPN